MRFLIHNLSYLVIGVIYACFTLTKLNSHSFSLISSIVILLFCGSGYVSLVLLRLANELGNLMASGASAWRELVVREVLATKPGTKPVDEGSCAGEPAATRLTNPHRRQSSRTMSSAPVW